MDIVYILLSIFYKYNRNQIQKIIDHWVMPPTIGNDTTKEQNWKQ